MSRQYVALRTSGTKNELIIAFVVPIIDIVIMLANADLESDVRKWQYWTQDKRQ